MNLQSIILLGVVLAVFGLVLYRYVKRQKKSHGCNCGCGCHGCDECK